MRPQPARHTGRRLWRQPAVPFMAQMSSLSLFPRQIFRIGDRHLWRDDGGKRGAACSRVGEGGKAAGVRENDHFDGLPTKAALIAKPGHSGLPRGRGLTLVLSVQVFGHRISGRERATITADVMQAAASHVTLRDVNADARRDELGFMRRIRAQQRESAATIRAERLAKELCRPTRHRTSLQPHRPAAYGAALRTATRRAGQCRPVTRGG